jgi:hypothetical protein
MAHPAIRPAYANSYRKAYGSGGPYEWLRNAGDPVLDQFADELTETLPASYGLILQRQSGGL